MKYRQIKEEAIREMVSEDWDGRSHDERHEAFKEFGARPTWMHQREFAVSSGKADRDQERKSGHSAGPNPSVRKFNFDRKAREYKERQRRRDEEIDQFVKTLQDMAEDARSTGMSCGTGMSDSRYVGRMNKIYDAVKKALATIEEGIREFNKNAAWNAGTDDGTEPDDADVDDDDGMDDESGLRERESWAASQYAGASDEDAYSDLDDTRNGW